MLLSSAKDKWLNEIEQLYLNFAKIINGKQIALKWYKSVKKMQQRDTVRIKIHMKMLHSETAYIHVNISDLFEAIIPNTKQSQNQMKTTNVTQYQWQQKTFQCADIFFNKQDTNVVIA